MAKTSMINREAKRAKLAKQHAAKRDALKQVIASQDASYEDKMAAATKLQKLPRDLASLRESLARLAGLRAPLADSPAPLIGQLFDELETPYPALELLVRAVAAHDDRTFDQDRVGEQRVEPLFLAQRLAGVVFLERLFAAAHQFGGPHAELLQHGLQFLAARRGLQVFDDARRDALAGDDLAGRTALRAAGVVVDDDVFLVAGHDASMKVERTTATCSAAGP